MYSVTSTGRPQRPLSQLESASCCQVISVVTSIPAAIEAVPPAADLKPEQVEALWVDLAGNDAGKANRSMLNLAGARGLVEVFMRERLQAAPTIDAKQLEQWLADLDSEKFAVRNRAMEELTKLGEPAVPALNQLLGGQPTLEVRRRAEEVLDRLTGRTLTGEQLRTVRAVEVLEQLGTPEAKRVLETLARGAAGALPTREAQAALGRLNASR